MLKRKVYRELLQWKEQRRTEQVRKCLLLKGARQVGKSFIIEKKKKKEYASFLKIDFFLQPNMKGIFACRACPEAGAEVPVTSVTSDFYY